LSKIAVCRDRYGALYALFRHGGDTAYEIASSLCTAAAADARREADIGGAESVPGPQ
jgi:hypothetical protein